MTRDLLLWNRLLLVFVSTCFHLTAGRICLKGCRCPDIEVALCRNASLAAVPIQFACDLRKLDISFNKLTSLNRDTFDSCANFIEIIFAHNSISEITRDAFENQRRLEKIDLSWNSLTRLNALIFKPLIKLHWISLAGNPLHLTTFGNFLESSSVIFLNMSYSSLERIPNGTFRMLDNMQVLDISYNKFLPAHVEQFFEYESLKTLFINDSETTFYRPTSFVVNDIDHMNHSCIRNAVTSVSQLKLSSVFPINKSFTIFGYFSCENFLVERAPQLINKEVRTDSSTATNDVTTSTETILLSGQYARHTGLTIPIVIIILSAIQIFMGCLLFYKIHRDSINNQ